MTSQHPNQDAETFPRGVINPISRPNLLANAKVSSERSPNPFHTQEQPAQPVVMRDNNSTLSNDAQNLLRRLLHILDHRSTTSNGNYKVLLSIKIDGICYSLIRHKSNAPDVSKIKISPRESDIVQLVSEGLSNKAIAAKLGISQYTVQSYLQRLYSKLGVSCRAEMVAVVLRQDMIAWDDFHQSGQL